MNWMDKILVPLMAHLYSILVMDIKPTSALPQISKDGAYYSEENNHSSDGLTMEKYIEMLSSLLMEPWPPEISPLVYIENEIDQFLRHEDAQIYTEPPELSENKRSKYYRRYPLKRQNVKLRYDAENRYMCFPSREEVIKLLAALHEKKQGKRGNTISFCNRRRPVRAVFTNIRFLGK